jgi:hypothetical protein
MHPDRFSMVVLPFFGVDDPAGPPAGRSVSIRRSDGQSKFRSVPPNRPVPLAWRKPVPAIATIASDDAAVPAGAPGCLASGQQ